MFFVSGAGTCHSFTVPSLEAESTCAVPTYARPVTGPEWPMYSRSLVAVLGALPPSGVGPAVSRALPSRPQVKTLPLSVSLREQMPPVYDQGQLGSCTANSIGAILEFNEHKQAEKVTNRQTATTIRSIDVISRRRAPP